MAVATESAKPTADNSPALQCWEVRAINYHWIRPYNPSTEVLGYCQSSRFAGLVDTLREAIMNSKHLPLTFHPATPSRWADLAELFGERGACGGCWCMFWRLPRKEFDAGKGSANKHALKTIVTAGRTPGILGYLRKEPVAWCAVAPRQDYTALERSRILKPVDDRLVWSVSCLFINKTLRRQGVSAQLLRAAVEFAAKKGARIVEGYPVEPSMEKMPDPFLWHGTPSAFKAAGFKEVLRRSRSRPIMRYEISS